MRNDLLHVIVPMSNPVRWQVRDKHFQQCIQHMLDSGVRLTVVECAYGDRPFQYNLKGVNHVGVRANTIVWNKENLINLGFRHLPSDWQYAAWVDGDITFRDKQWASETVHALQHYAIVQPWTNALDLGPNGEFQRIHKSFCFMWFFGNPVIPGPEVTWKKDGGHYEYPHTGFAWASRRDILERTGGLFDCGVSGSGDHHMAFALVGEVERSVPQRLIDACPVFVNRLRGWQYRALHHINGNIGYVRGSIEHKFHGTTKNRRYWDRWQIFINNKFDPDMDLKHNLDGVLELSGNKPQLRLDIDRYMRERAEDANLM